MGTIRTGGCMHDDLRSCHGQTGNLSMAKGTTPKHHTEHWITVVQSMDLHSVQSPYTRLTQARASQFSLFMTGTATHANQLIPSQTKIKRNKFVYGYKETHISSLVTAFLYLFSHII